MLAREMRREDSADLTHGLCQALSGLARPDRIDQRRHRIAPCFGRDFFVDRAVGDDLGAMLVKREIDENARAPARACFGGGAEEQDRAAAHPAGLGRARRHQHA